MERFFGFLLPFLLYLLTVSAPTRRLQLATPRLHARPATHHTYHTAHARTHGAAMAATLKRNLLSAAKNGQTDEVRRLLAAKADLESKDEARVALAGHPTSEQRAGRFAIALW